MTLPDPLLGRFADLLIEDLASGDWHTLRNSFSAIADALQHIRETRDPRVELDGNLPTVVGLAIEKLGEPDVEHAVQAYLWTLSNRPIHRARGEAWLHAHSAERQAFERDVAVEHVELILKGGSVHDETDGVQPPLPPRRISFRAFHDDEAGVWSATSDDHITAEAPSRQDLLDRLKAIVPDLLESREGRTGPLTLVVDWQERGMVDQSTLAIA